MTEDREVAVVGAGLLGLATAYALTERGRDVVVFEQASVGHVDGGSHGTARVFRLGYPDPGYVGLAKRALRAWRELESATGERLLVPCGQLTFGARLAELEAALREAGAPCEALSPREAAERFPEVTAEGPCLYEGASCVIAADRVLAVLAGALPDLRTGTPVSRVEPDGDRVSVRAGDRMIRARAAVVCAGPWTGTLLAGAGVTIPGTATLERVAYVARAAGRPAAGSRPPIFIRYGPRAPYGLPVPGSDLLKVGLHPMEPGMAGPVIVPGGRDTAGGGQGWAGGHGAELAGDLVELVRRYLPGYDPVPVTVELCVYDNSPDEDFVLDRRGPLVVGCGTSGHGFKFGPLLGEWLADFATGHPPNAMPPRFSLARFG